MYIVTHRRIFFLLTGIIVLVALGAIAVFRLPLSIDFTGGSLVEVAYTDTRPALPEIQAGVNNLALGEVSVRESGTNGVLVRARTLTPEEHTAVLGVLSEQGAHPFTELRFNSIGPALGSELGIKAIYAIFAVIAAIVLYIAWAFRQVSKPVSSWIYGLTVVIILLHDIIIPVGFYAILCPLHGACRWTPCS